MFSAVSDSGRKVKSDIRDNKFTWDQEKQWTRDIDTIRHTEQIKIRFILLFHFIMNYNVHTNNLIIIYT